MAMSSGQAKGHGHSKTGAHGHGGKHAKDSIHSPQDGGHNHLINDNGRENVFTQGM